MYENCRHLINSIYKLPSIDWANLIIEVKIFVVNVKLEGYVWWTCFSTDRQSAFLGELAVLLFSPICPFFCMEHISRRGFSTKYKNKYKKTNQNKPARSGPLFSRSVTCTMSLHVIIQSLASNGERTYPTALEMKDTTNTAKSVSHLGIPRYLDREGRLRMKFYDKWDDFNFDIMKFSFIHSHNSAAPAYGVYFSRLKRYNRFTANKKVTETRIPCG